MHSLKKGVSYGKLESCLTLLVDGVKSINQASGVTLDFMTSSRLKI